jgi:hypothetical protein
MISDPRLLDRVFSASKGKFPDELARQILDFHFPPEDRAKYLELSDKAQQGNLSKEEQSQLDDYLNVNDFLMVLKAKASESLQTGKPAA